MLLHTVAVANEVTSGFARFPQEKLYILLPGPNINASPKIIHDFYCREIFMTVTLLMTVTVLAPSGKLYNVNLLMALLVYKRKN